MKLIKKSTLSDKMLKILKNQLLSKVVRSYFAMENML